MSTVQPTTDVTPGSHAYRATTATPVSAPPALAGLVPACLTPWALPTWADDVTVAEDFVHLSHIVGAAQCRAPFTDRPSAGLLVTVESSVELVDIEGARFAGTPATPYLRIDLPMSSEITTTPAQARALATLLVTAADFAEGAVA